MLHRGGLEVYTNNDFQFSSANIYVSGTWVTAVPYVYTSGAWAKSGAAGTTMDYFYTSDNQQFDTSNNEPFLVRRN